ncbi:NADH-dependent flavin oxidoreductase [Rhizoctonia solani AG-1 IB]|uniref:NADH-dependent flavin oxidoreductase n=1 Tax=Thanatephorus cucumeris (strain AG1-IB / isolate 7/3/14) TaxID=1108050 RepID=M5BZX0_THACB|nr:NADH-dependent flavin oxidoreductase [Rhizoctonia solani AG-1 IB]
MVLERHGHEINLDNARFLGESIHMPFSKRIAKSRFLKAAMSEYMASWDKNDPSKCGIPSDRLVRLYEKWGQAGYGIIITGNVMLHPEQLEAPGNAILCSLYETPKRIEQFRRVAAAGKAGGSLMIMQISHPGRQVPAFINPNPLGASDIKLVDQVMLVDSIDRIYGKPRPLDRAGILEIVDQYSYTAEAAYRAGQVRRSNEYGGSITNRARIIRNVVHEIRSKVTDPGFVIGIKINSVEFQAKGFQPEEAADLCKELESMRLDFVELSGGTYEELGWKHAESTPRESTKRREAFFATFAEEISPRLTQTAPYLTGGFRSAAGMVEAIKSGICQGIGIARPAGSDPMLPTEIIQGLISGSADVKLPPEDIIATILATGVQMESMARGIPVIDLSDPEQVLRFKDAAQAHHEKKATRLRQGIIDPGYFVLTPSSDKD